MSPENVEVVTQLHAEFDRTLRAVSRLLAPDFIWDMSTFRGWPDDAEYRGAEGFDRFFAAWVVPWEEWDLEIDEIADVGNDEVLALGDSAEPRRAARHPWSCTPAPSTRSGTG